VRGTANAVIASPQLRADLVCHAHVHGALFSEYVTAIYSGLSFLAGAVYRCASCKSLYPKLSKICAENPQIVVVKVNFEENKELAKKFGVKVFLASFRFCVMDMHSLPRFMCCCEVHSSVQTCTRTATHSYIPSGRSVSAC
jgi:hypothetical protein